MHYQVWDKDYEDALTWLEDAGSIYRIFNKSHEPIYRLFFPAIFGKTAVFFRQFDYICSSET